MSKILANVYKTFFFKQLNIVKNNDVFNSYGANHGYDGIQIDRYPSESKLAAIDITNCPTWRKEISSFNWQFTQQEVAYILAGEAVVTPINTKNRGKGIHIKKGDLVTFPAGLETHWSITEEIYKHYHIKSAYRGQRFLWKFAFKVNNLLRAVFTI